MRGVRAALAWVLLEGCVSPTLPPDDPPAPEVELGQGTARLSGFISEAPVSVVALNRSSGLLFGQRSETGAYAFDVALLHPCDPLSLWYEAGTFRSSSVHFNAAERAGQPELCDERSAPAPDAGAPDAADP